MQTLFLLLLAFAAGFAFWSASRGAAERAIALGREACAAAVVQLIDQTVHATGLRLRRHDDRWLRIERTFRFEYSEDGTDRQSARMVLRGDRLVAFSGPAVRPSGDVLPNRLLQ